MKLSKCKHFILFYFIFTIFATNSFLNGKNRFFYVLAQIHGIHGGIIEVENGERFEIVSNLEESTLDVYALDKSKQNAPESIQLKSVLKRNPESKIGSLPNDRLTLNLVNSNSISPQYQGPLLDNKFFGMPGNLIVKPNKTDQENNPRSHSSNNKTYSEILMAKSLLY